MGSHEQVGCEKPSTLSGRQKTVLVVAVDRVVCACVCVSVCCKPSLPSLCGCVGIAVLVQHCWLTKHILQRKRNGSLSETVM